MLANAFTICTLALTTVAGATATITATATATDSVPSKGEMIDAIRAWRDRLPEFTVECETRRASADEPGAVRSVRERIEVRPGAYHARITRSFETADGLGSYSNTAEIFHGDALFANYFPGHCTHPGHAIVSTDAARTGPASQGSLALAQSMGWKVLEGAAGIDAPQDLVQLLERDDVVIGEQLELVDGVATVRVDLVNALDGSVFERLHLDPAHGFLPRRRRVTLHGEVVSEWRVTEFAEVAPGARTAPMASGRSPPQRSNSRCFRSERPARGSCSRRRRQAPRFRPAPSSSSRVTTRRSPVP